MIQQGWRCNLRAHMHYTSRGLDVSQVQPYRPGKITCLGHSFQWGLLRQPSGRTLSCPPELGLGQLPCSYHLLLDVLVDFVEARQSF